MDPKLITLSLFFADAAKVAPCGRTYPRLLDVFDAFETLDCLELPVEIRLVDSEAEEKE